MEPRKGLTRREFEVTDMSEILDILDKCLIVHIGMIDGDEPYVVPLNYGYTMEDGQLTLYLHGAAQGRKLDVMRANPKVFFEMNCEVTPFEGKMACQYGTSYSCLMGRGTAEVLENVEAKKKGLSLFMKTQTGKDFEFTDGMISTVSVMKIHVSEFTAKRRPMPYNIQK